MELRVWRPKKRRIVAVVVFLHIFSSQVYPFRDFPDIVAPVSSTSSWWISRPATRWPFFLPVDFEQVQPVPHDSQVASACLIDRNANAVQYRGAGPRCCDFLRYTPRHENRSARRFALCPAARRLLRRAISGRCADVFARSQCAASHARGPRFSRFRDRCVHGPRAHAECFGSASASPTRARHQHAATATGKICASGVSERLAGATGLSTGQRQRCYAACLSEWFAGAARLPAVAAARARVSERFARAA